MFYEVEVEEVVDLLEKMRSDTCSYKHEYDYFTSMENRIKDSDETFYSLYEDFEYSIVSNGIYRKLTDTLYKTV